MQVNVQYAAGAQYLGPERRTRAAQQPQWAPAMLDELDYGILLLGPDRQLMLMNHAARAELDTMQVNVQYAAGAQYLGPERRTRAAQQPQWAPAMLDELDYGILLLGPDRQLMLMNHAARAELDTEHPLQVLGRELRAREPQDVAALHEALVAASNKGLRRLLALGSGEHRVSLAVVPLERGSSAQGEFASMVTLGKRRVCEKLSVQWFAQAHALTPAEARVLEALCCGLSPRAAALQQGVGLATVRTQVGNIRAKTHARDIRSVVQQVALLPPMVSSLRGGDAAEPWRRASSSAGQPLRCVDGHLQARPA